MRRVGAFRTCMRRHQRAALAGDPGGFAERAIDGIGFRRAGQIQGALRQRQLALGAAQLLVGGARGDRERQRRRVGEADVLARHAHEAARDVARVLAAREHPREPVQGGVGIGAAHRFVQRADQVVVRLLLPIIERHAPLQNVSQSGRIEARLGREIGQVLDHVQQIAAIAVGELDQARTRLGIERQLVPDRSLGACDQRLEGLVVQPIEHQHLTARHERAGEREGRVLGGRADQGDRAVLDLGQQPVLLGAIEAVDLVDEQERGLAGAPPRLRLLVHLAQVGHPGHHRRELHERLTEAPREQTSERGLAGAGRPPQDDRAEPAAREHAPERRVRAEQMVLADQLVESLRPQPVSERLTGCDGAAAARGLGSREQIAHPPTTTASLRPARSISSRQGSSRSRGSLAAEPYRRSTAQRSWKSSRRRAGAGGRQGPPHPT